ncbi:hypothetical protein SK128_002733, partial [Halocaridina rubra]
ILKVIVINKDGTAITYRQNARLEREIHNLSYEERLRESDLTSLEARRVRRDM